MVTFTLSQSVWEFTKLHAIYAMRASVVCVPTWQRRNVPNACQLLIFTCQRANKRANVGGQFRNHDFLRKKPARARFLTSSELRLHRE